MSNQQNPSDPSGSDNTAEELDAFENHPLAPLNITKRPLSVRKPVGSAATEQLTPIHEAMGSLSIYPTNEPTHYQSYQTPPSQAPPNSQIYAPVPTASPVQPHTEYPQAYRAEARHSISAGSNPHTPSSPGLHGAPQTGAQLYGTETSYQAGGYPQGQQDVGSQPSPSINYAAPAPAFNPYQPTQTPSPAQSSGSPAQYQPPVPLAPSPINHQQAPKPPPPSGPPPGHQPVQNQPSPPAGIPPSYQQPQNGQSHPPGAPPNFQTQGPPPPAGTPPQFQQAYSPPVAGAVPSNFQQTQYHQPIPSGTPPNFQQPHNPPTAPATPPNFPQGPIPPSGTPPNVQRGPIPPSGVPPNFQQAHNLPHPPAGMPPNYQHPQSAPILPSGAPPNFQQGGAPPPGAPLNHQQPQNGPPLGGPPNFQQGGPPPSGLPPNHPQPQNGPNLPPGAPLNFQQGGPPPSGLPPNHQQPPNSPNPSPGVPPNFAQPVYHSPQPVAGIPQNYQHQHEPRTPQSPPVTPIPYQYPQQTPPPQTAGGPPGHHAQRSQSMPQPSPYQYQHVQSAPLQHGGVGSPTEYFATPLQHSQSLGAQNVCPTYCSSCKTGIPYEVQYSECGICAVNLCHNCVAQHTSAHQHSMTRLISRQTLASAFRDPRTCGLCRKSIHVRLECRICQFSICSDCYDSADGPRHIHNDYTRIEPPGLMVLLQNVAVECRDCVFRPTLGHCDRCLLAIPSHDVVMECATCDLTFDRSIGLCRKCHSETAHLHDPNHRWVSLGSQLCTDEAQKPGIFACRECNWRSSDFNATIAPSRHPHTSLYLFMGPNVLQIMLPIIYKNCCRKPMRIDSPSPINTKVGTGTHWSCDFCRNKFLMPVGYVCKGCPDFCLCNYCFPTASHLHKHGQGAFAYQPPPTASPAAGPAGAHTRQPSQPHARAPGPAPGAGRGRGHPVHSHSAPAAVPQHQAGAKPLKLGVKGIDKHLEKWDKNGKLNSGIKTSGMLMKQAGTGFVRGFLGTGGKTVHHHHYHPSSNNNNNNNANNNAMIFAGDSEGGDAGGDSGMGGDMGGDSGMAGDSGASSFLSAGDSGGGDSGGGIWSSLASVATSPILFGGDSGGGDSGGGGGDSGGGGC